MTEKRRYSSSFTFDGRRYYCKGATQREADQKAALRLADLQRGAVAASRMTVAEWWPEYLATYHARASEKVRRNYDSIYKYAIAPYIGAKTIKSVRGAELQKILNNLSTRSESYAKKAILLLRGMFRVAADNELIPRDPSRGLILPEAVPEVPRRELTPAEREAFLKAARSCGQPGRFFLLIYYTGLRPSEAARVRFEDFDRKARTLTVRGTKTKAATRTVPVPDAYEIPEGEGLLFVSRYNDAPQETCRHKWWKKVTARMEEITGDPVASELTPYCLRHDYCTRLLDAGVPLDAASYIMGHASIQITAKRYRHPTDQMVANALDVFNAAQ